MAMCMMPLVIKVEMTYENYKSLLLEAVQRYKKSYLRKNYHFDGKYFTLNICDMDNYELFTEAKMIAKYASPTDECVGLIFSGGQSYATKELFFKNKQCITKNPVDSKCMESIFKKHKTKFLSRFPKRKFCYFSEIDDILTVKSEYNNHLCLSMTVDVLEAIYEEIGYTVKDIDNYDSKIYVTLNNSKLDASLIIAQYFGYQNAILFVNPQDVCTSDEIMILLMEK